MPSDPPKYSLLEIERRWRIDPENLPDLDGLPFQDIEDRYFLGTRLRLRRITSPLCPPVLKLCKKYGPTSNVTEPITNIYLDESEYSLFKSIRAEVVRKRRYAYAGGSLDLFDHRGPVFEVEFSSEADAIAYAPPDFVGEEDVALPWTSD